jgi:ethanolamine utilization microcompartment shell protein EutL
MAKHLLLSISLLVLASGCAVTQVQPQLQPAVATGVVSNDRSDLAYMAAVERAARAANVQVVWINPPQRRAPQTP